MIKPDFLSLFSWNNDVNLQKTKKNKKNSEIIQAGIMLLLVAIDSIKRISHSHSHIDLAY